MTHHIGYELTIALFLELRGEPYVGKLNFSFSCMAKHMSAVTSVYIFSLSHRVANHVGMRFIFASGRLTIPFGLHANASLHTHKWYVDNEQTMTKARG